MAQTKRGTLVLQVGGWAAGWRPTSVKKMLVTKSQRMSLGSVRRRRTWRCLRIGTWNVMSLYRPGASSILKQEMEKVQMDLVKASGKAKP